MRAALFKVVISRQHGKVDCADCVAEILRRYCTELPEGEYFIDRHNTDKASTNRCALGAKCRCAQQANHVRLEFKGAASNVG